MALATRADDDGRMTIKLIGQVVGHAGLVQNVEADGTPTPYTMRPDRYLREQPATIPLHFDHDRTWTIGTVGHLQRSRSQGLLMVGTLPDDDLADLLADGPWYLSDSTTARPLDEHRLEWSGRQIKEISLVRRSANLNTRPIAWSRHDGQPPMNLYWRSCWDDACKAMTSSRYRRAPDHLTIVDLDGLEPIDEMWTDPAAARRAAIGLLETELATRAEPDAFADGPVHRHTFGTVLSFT